MCSSKNRKVRDGFIQEMGFELDPTRREEMGKHPNRPEDLHQSSE
jgi:hypothetical protein